MIAYTLSLLIVFPCSHHVGPPFSGAWQGLALQREPRVLLVLLAFEVQDRGRRQARRVKDPADVALIV